MDTKNTEANQANEFLKYLHLLTAHLVNLHEWWSVVLFTPSERAALTVTPDTVGLPYKQSHSNFVSTFISFFWNLSVIVDTFSN